MDRTCSSAGVTFIVARYLRLGHLLCDPSACKRLKMFIDRSARADRPMSLRTC